MLELLLPALLGGCGIAIIAAPLGAFVIWRRMAYFGDTLAHSALLGIAIGLLIDMNIHISVTLSCLTLAVLLVVLQHQRVIATDTLLGILAHSTLALGLVVVSLTDQRLDLMSYLFGDLLSMNGHDLVWIGIGGAVVLITITLLWRPLLAITLHEDLAQVDGVPVLAVRLCLMALIAIVIALAMKLVGIMLITSLMIIPAASARHFANTPEKMVLIGSVMGCLTVMIGIGGSAYFDTPTGPSIVVGASVLFLITTTMSTVAKRFKHMRQLNVS